MERYPPWVPLALRTPANQQSAVGLGFPHLARRHRPGGSPCSSPVGWSGACVEGFYDRGMGPYPPRLPLAPPIPANQRSASRVGVSTLPGGIYRGITVSSPVRRICRDGRVSDPEMGSCPPRVRRLAVRTSSQSAINQWGWGVHTFRGGIGPGDHHVRPRLVGLIDV